MIGFDCLFVAGLAVGLDPEGYGNPDFCWISIYDKLIWSFAGPIGIVILVTLPLFVWCKALYWYEALYIKYALKKLKMQCNRNVVETVIPSLTLLTRPDISLR